VPKHFKVGDRDKTDHIAMHKGGALEKIN